MTQKVDIENLSSEASKDTKIRPYIEAPEVVIKKAVRKTMILVIVFLLVSGGLVFYLVKKTSTLATELQNKQNLIFLTNESTQMSTDLLRQWKELEPNIGKINNSLPSSNDLLGYLGILEQISGASGVSQNIKLQTKATGQAPVNLPGNNSASSKGGSVDYTIELKGNLQQFVNYTQALTKAPYFTKITDFNITGTNGLNSDATATFGAKVYTYN